MLRNDGRKVSEAFVFSVKPYVSLRAECFRCAVRTGSAPDPASERLKAVLLVYRKHSGVQFKAGVLSAGQGCSKAT